MAGDGVPDRDHDDGADHRHQSRNDKAVMVVVKARPSALNSTPPASAPTNPKAILTRQPPPRLPMTMVASQPTKAPKTIQPRICKSIPPHGCLAVRLRSRRSSLEMVVARR